MVQPTGIAADKVQEALVLLRAWGEINGVPLPQLDAILDKARKDLEFKPDFPPGPPGPP